MKNLFAALLFAAAPASAAERLTVLPDFQFTGAAALKADKVVLAEPAPRPADVITANHLHIQAGKSVLFGYADTQEQFAEAVARWSDVLRSAGIEPGRPTFQDGFFTLPYKTADGRALRAFTADPKQFPPKDEAGLRANMALALDALRRAGLTPVSARVLNLDMLLPTYQILYLTKPDAVEPMHETQLRVLKPGDDIDMDMIRLSGVTMVQTPASWMLVYVGPQLGIVGMAAKTLEEAQAKLEKRKAWLVENGKRIIGSKIAPLDDAEWKYGVDVYFFQ